MQNKTVNLTQVLYQKVFNQYFDGLKELDEGSRYHLLHHLYLWSRDDRSKKELDKIRDLYVLDNATAKNYLSSINTKTNLPIKNAITLRQPFLDKYPQIRVKSRLLLEAMYLDSVFGYDARSIVYELISPEELDSIFDQLIGDQESIAILSTFAANFLYIYDRYFKNRQKVDENMMLEIGHKDYDLSDMDQFLLKLYFYTHCIINETLFYWLKIPTEKLATYQKMVQEIDRMLADNFENAHMDIKFEAIVCAKICGIKLSVEQRIYEEALSSVSDEGNFIIDLHNNVPQTDFSTFNTSEHRNVLFLMSRMPFKPTRS